MAASSTMSLSLLSTSTLTERFDIPSSSKPIISLGPSCFSNHHGSVTCSNDALPHEERNCQRRALMLGVGALAFNLSTATSVLAQGMPNNFEAFVDYVDGYSYYYPSDWRGFDFMGHDSAFKDRYLQMQNVRLSFIPTDKSDIHDLGTLEDVVFHLVNHVYSAPTQVANVMDMREKNIDGRNYYTFEYALTNKNFSRAAFATLAIGNAYSSLSRSLNRVNLTGRYYTLIVGANERRWRRLRNQLKVVADSFRLLDI
ncbi:OLC1v1027711C1 [Oldenlandia corymbosa var. corymbosa]|uniref:OLC1v1027711C1 n=1 Tax=Oldenlandia corymbosa var. corymbosa TaxID=529605 RepID=A0AAV1CA42_OLDCO|nr:OLC1v1027711C1 [Oldenlandia corymbosa var. corymbosa]